MLDFKYKWVCVHGSQHFLTTSSEMLFLLVVGISWNSLRGLKLMQKKGLHVHSKTNLIKLLGMGPLEQSLLWGRQYDWKGIRLIRSVPFCFMLNKWSSSVSGSMLLFKIANTESKRLAATDIIVHHHTNHVGNYLASSGMSYIEFSVHPGLRFLYILFKGFYSKSIDAMKYRKAWMSLGFHFMFH